MSRRASQGVGRSEDQLAFLRDAHEFRNLLLVEQPNGSYADTIARQFLFDHWHVLLLRALARSSDARIAEIAAKAVKEVAYHVERSSDWVVRLGDGTEESHARMQARDRRAVDVHRRDVRARRRRSSRWSSAGVAADVRDAARAVGRCGGRRARGGDADAAGRRVRAQAAASRACTPSTSGGCWPRCSSCSAPIRTRNGDCDGAREAPCVRRRALARARCGTRCAGVPDPEIPVVSIVELGIVRGVAWLGGTLRVTRHADLFGMPGDRRDHRGHRRALRDVRACATCAIEIALAPPWTTDWIAPEAKAQAARVRHRAAGRAAIARRRAPASARCAARAGSRVPALRLDATTLLAQFGSTACKALYRCDDCREPFDYFKPF